MPFIIVSVISHTTLTSILRLHDVLLITSEDVNTNSWTGLEHCLPISLLIGLFSYVGLSGFQRNHYLPPRVPAKKKIKHREFKTSNNILLLLLQTTEKKTEHLKSIITVHSIEPFFATFIGHSHPLFLFSNSWYEILLSLFCQNIFFCGSDNTVQPS